MKDYQMVMINFMCVMYRGNDTLSKVVQYDILPSKKQYKI